MRKLPELAARNRAWAEETTREDPAFFERLARQQAPQYLWIGCSDSRVPANQIVGLEPGEMFVHRNVANVVVHSDLNCLSVIQYAVEVLRVQHVHDHHREGFTGSMTQQQSIDRLTELNVIEQALNVSRTTILQEAWGRGQSVAVHGWIYRLRDGIIRD